MRTLLFLYCILLSFLSAQAQTKKAFMVGIGNYEDSGLGWDNISGDKDLIYLKEFLKTQGFQENDIQLLQMKRLPNKMY